MSEQISGGADNQAASVTRVAASASEEMTQTIVDVARNSSNIAESVAETTKMAKEGEGIVIDGFGRSRKMRTPSMNPENL